MQANNNDVLRMGRFVFDGYMGQKVDTMAHGRLLSDAAWNVIYAEAEVAFRNRVDDTMIEGVGRWQGEFWGKHILSAVAAARYYNDDSLKNRLQLAADGQIATQDQDGYIGTYRDSTFLKGNNWNVWCRKYTLWGLVELWHVLKDDRILDAASRMLDHLIGEVGPGRTPIIETGNFYGLPSTSILQPVVELYRVTKNQSHLDFAQYIVEQWGQGPEGIPNILGLGLENRPVHEWFDTPWRWAKGYEFSSCLEGLLELYREVDDPDYLQAVINIQRQIEAHEQSFLGSVSFDDKLIGAGRFKNTVSEICDNVYWSRLNANLYRITGDSHYLELIEQTLYNGLLPGMKPDGSWGLRRQRSSHEHIPAHPHCNLENHQCCVANLPRGLFQAGENVLAADGHGLRIGLYAPGQGEVTLADGRVASVEIQGDYPFDSRPRIKVTTSDGESCAIKLRKPSWSQAIGLTCGDEALAFAETDGWCEIAAVASGRTIDVDLGPLLHRKSFEPAPASQDDLDWRLKYWAKMGLVSEDGGRQEISSLKESDAIDPTTPATAFFLGPLALARDTRLGDSDVLSPVPGADGEPELNEVTAPPEGIHKAWTMRFPDGSSLRLCDYPSAGNTWDRSSRFATWIDVSSSQNIQGDSTI